MHEMGEYRFQRFVTDLVGYEPDIATSSEYGLRGQADYGADVVAQRTGGDGHEVASCKCYEQTSARQIREWSDEFLDHWEEHWRDQDIRRFVLAVAATNSSSQSVQEQARVERARFKALGLIYEIWGPTTLVRKVRPHRTVAATYLTEAWATIICGPVMEPALTSASNATIVSAALIRQVAELQQRLSAQALLAADRALEDLRSGRTAAVRALVEEQRRAENWTQLDAAAQARIVRLSASLSLRDADVGSAERLAVEADALAPADEPRLAANIVLERDGPAAALHVLGKVSSTAGLQLRTALLVMADDVANAATAVAELVARDAGDAETIRLEALVALASNERGAALAHIRRAEAIAPHWNAVLQVGAMARYARAVSPTLTPEWLLGPNAFDLSFILEDVDSQALLEEAFHLIDRLVEAEPNVAVHRVWRLAILSAMRSRREQACMAAGELLSSSDHDPSIVALCLYRSIDVDLKESERVLTSRYEGGTDASSVRVLGMLLARRGDGTATLRSSLERQTGDALIEAREWIARLDPAAAPDDMVDDPSGAALRRAHAEDDWRGVAERLDELLSSGRPDPGGQTLAEAAAASGQYDLIAPHVEALLSFRTATAVRLAAAACHQTGDSERALAILADDGAVFGEALPADMRRLRAEALAHSGNIPAALREADGIAGSGTPRDRLFRAEMFTSTGNVRAAVPAVREALDAGLLTGERAFRWSRLMQAEEPGLARRLLERAVATDLDKRFAAAAMHDAIGLRLDAEASTLMAKVHARATSGAPEVIMLTSDDLPRIIAEQQAHIDEVERMYLDGAIPAHLRFTDPVEFALLHLGSNRTASGDTRPWLLRHGGRPQAIEYDLPFSAWRIHMDVTALLVAARLELLDAIEGNPKGISIPAFVPTLLISMELGCSSRKEATVAERVLAAPMRPAGMDDSVAVQVAAREGDGSSSVARLPLAALVQALSERRVIEPDQATAVMRDLPGFEGRATVPAEGSALLLDPECVHRLAAADLISTVALRYDLRCDGRILDQAAAAREQAATARDAALRLSALRTRIATGLEAGTWRTIPRTATTEEDEGPDFGDAPLVRCLQDVLAAPAIDGAVAWIDDRLVTGYVRTGSMPVVGVADVLEAMRKEGRLTPARQEEASDELRGAGGLYLVPSVDEVARALVATPRRGQHVFETPLLAAKRRAIAFAAVHERNLAVGGARPATDRPDEVVPMQTAMRLLAGCLGKVWLDDTLGFDDLIACSDWLWLNVRRTHVGRVIPGEDPASAQNAFEIVQIAHCLDQAIEIGLLNDRRRDTRLRYLQWLWLRAIEPLAEVDGTFLPRLGRYLADFYAELARDREPRSRRDRRIMRALLARRIVRLPEPIQNEVFRDARMAMFGTSQERITLRGKSFDPTAFWREVRRTMRYGHGRLRPLRPSGRSRPVRLRRDGIDVVLTGAIRARLGEDVIRIAGLDGHARTAAIRRLVENLRLAPSMAEEAIAAAAEARSTTEMIRVLHNAREGSAEARYADAAAKLGRRERIRLDAFAPAPFASVLASLGLGDTARPFTEAVIEARRSLNTADPRGGFAATAGIPVLRPEIDRAVVSEMAAERARTPMAIVHAMAAARAAGAPGPVLASLTEQLLKTVERAGALFMTLLRWTNRHSLRDPAWREAPHAYALAAVWGHADRILDIALGSGLDPESLRRSLEGFEPAVAGVDLLQLQAGGVPDVAWPFWMSPAALLHHGLAAAFENKDVREVVGDELMERLRNAQTSHSAGVVAPEIRLLLRRDEWPNAMGSFFAGSPRGFDEEEFDRPQVRNMLIGTALDALEADPANRDAWLQLGGFSAGGFEKKQADRLIPLLQADPARLVRLVAGGAEHALWRVILQPIAWHDREEAARIAVALAAACRDLDRHRGDAATQPIEAERVAEELVEVASVIASCAGDGREEFFTHLLDGYSMAWPALTPVLHHTLGSLTARTPSGRAGSLWRLQNLLGSR